MAQLPLPKFDTPSGRKELNELLSTLDPDSDAKESPPITTAFSTAHEAFVRSILTDPSEPLGNYVFGPAYAPFDNSNKSYRASGNAAPEHSGTNKGVKIDPRYLSHPLDLELLARQVRFTEDAITRAEPLTRHLKPYTKRFTDLEVTKEYVRRTVDGAHHYVAVVYGVAELGASFIKNDIL
ncbi:hypothetical protein KVR01_010689 [Diaporthe batatas]|uniref:uncharacterized protein n=1 Tax=Diaporthe batatas TaxID=748121 RepID=UPI001D048052|nr:uncharacterized protein KVR01_010689 [Diaporthe batatas]KAG8160052.1 hypothetical protein KVR01_010689 [Diaporthe batatas]